MYNFLSSTRIAGGFLFRSLRSLNWVATHTKEPAAALFRASCRSFGNHKCVSTSLFSCVCFCRTDHRVCLHSRILYVQLKPFWRSLYHPSCARGFRKTNRTVTRVSSAHTTRGRPGLDGSHEMMPTEHLPMQAQFFFKDAYCSGDDTAMPKNLCQ